MKITGIIRERHFFVPCGVVGHYLKPAKKSNYSVNELADNLRKDDYSLRVGPDLPLADKAQVVIDAIESNRGQSTVGLMSVAVTFAVGLLGLLQTNLVEAFTLSRLVAVWAFLLIIYCLYLYRERKAEALLKQAMLIIKRNAEITQ